MGDPFQHKRGTTAQNDDYIGAEGEITIDTDKNTVVVHDGVTSGGHPLALEGSGGGSTSTIDDFEAGSLDSSYAGDTASFSVTTAAAQEGSYGLETSGNDVSIASTSGLNHYPQQGESFRYWYQHDGTGTPSDSIGWAAQSASSFPDGYYTYYDHANTEIQAFVRSGGSNTFLGTPATVTFSSGTWYEIEIGWLSDGSITVTAYDGTGTELAQTSATDTTFTSGGIAYRIRDASSSNKTTYIDYYRTV